jgi:hypothetical protein
MKYQQSLLAIAAMLSFTSANTQAALTSYNANGVDLVYSSVSNITWTKDANLLGSLETALGFNTVVNAIIAASPTINDAANGFDTPANSGHHTASVSDFNSSSLGLTSWFGAKAFISYLNSQNYGGSDQWRLPNVGTNPQYGFNLSGSELSELFYRELSGTPHSNIPISATFNNEQYYAYWSGKEATPDPLQAWRFSTSVGNQDYYPKNLQWYAWAVTPGQVAAVPVPAAVWLFGSGLLGLLGLKRRIAFNLS